MAYNNQQHPFWDFVRAFDPQHGAGVDHTAGPFPGNPLHEGPAGHHPPPPPPQHYGAFPFGGPWDRGFGGTWERGFGSPWGGRGGHRGRHGPHHGPHERRGSRGASTPPGEHPEGEQPEVERPEGEPRGESPHGRRGPRGCGRHGRGGHAHGCGGWGGHGRRGPSFDGPRGAGGFDLNSLMAALSSQPWAQPWVQTFNSYAQQAAGPQRSGETLVPEDEDEKSFVPPIDIFSTERAYVLHVALPGAKKEDVGVHWDEDKGVLNLAGVVYRQGDEEFLRQLAQSERKVGMFERTVRLPPGEDEKDEVDGDMITAKLEDGVLIVTVPKVEKEWTEVKRVDIE